jgi:SAM-dependent methyltransferase
MNRVHRWLCRSERWGKMLDQIIVPWVLSDVSLGDEVLEVGPGPGLTTDLLRARTAHLTALEIDPRLARSLSARLANTNVSVVQGDATAMPLKNAQFSGAVSFTMLHHVPSPALQDKLLREVHRSLKPGGVFAGVDSLQSFGMRVLHLWDTLVPVDPAGFRARLESAGFREPFVEANEHAFRFHARA